ncbi:hypothetical protein MDA_GLEAN10025883 [Myotis davidii]|uniref:Uncharacterized protein n=1 Tax=Myotis davidii TaxID=225400 RepID=L5LXW2_MYODS|nr:hypothetical protein MDA_GLEAN10025883 [Myotis davidii]
MDSSDFDTKELRQEQGRSQQAVSGVPQLEVSILPQAGDFAEAGAMVSTGGTVLGSFLPLLKALLTKNSHVKR